MPGLAGFTTPTRTGGDSITLERMQDLLTHRPFYKRDPLFCTDGIYGTRSHTDVVQRAEQPTRENDLYVWMDGEFFNQQVLDQRIQTPSSPASDPVRLCRLYRQNPDFSFLDAIDGIYAAVLYDAVRKKLHLITDRYGLNHLFWTVHNQQLAWASELKAFLALTNFSPSIDEKAVNDFFDVGYLMEDTTWFEEVRLLSPGHVRTWDIREQAFNTFQYWNWRNIKPISGNVDKIEAADELGRRFLSAVDRRADPDRQNGLGLSGGLDSRAILAAIPDEIESVCAITYARKESPDAQIASAAARVRGANHRLFEINEENWLLPRIEGVWWTDGQFNLRHMHSIQVNRQMRDLYEINLNGFLGDAVMGSYLRHRRFSEKELFNNRGRRFIRMGPRLADTFIHSRLPFMDNAFVDLAMALPRDLRHRERIYKLMLIRFFPQYFKDIPWQKTGLSINHPEFLQTAAAAVRKVRQIAGDVARSVLPGYRGYTSSYHDYPSWMRHEPARSIFTEILRSPMALYPEYICADEVRQTLDLHMSGRNRADLLCQYLTFEIWLQQVFEQRFRTENEILEELYSSAHN